MADGNTCTEQDDGLSALDNDISDLLVSALKSIGVKRLTPVQVECLPHCNAGKDVMAKAKTGIYRIIVKCFIFVLYSLILKYNTFHFAPL